MTKEVYMEHIKSFAGWYWGVLWDRGLLRKRGVEPGEFQEAETWACDIWEKLYDEHGERFQREEPEEIDAETEALFDAAELYPGF